MARKPEKNYLEIARKKIKQPSELPPKWRFFIYSRHKKGKTRFLISADEGEPGKILIADAERGTDKYRSPKTNPHMWPITRWEDMDELWGALRTGELSPYSIGRGKSRKPYQFVGIDTVTKINNLALKYVQSVEADRSLDTKPQLVSKQYYYKSGELMKDLVLKLDALPIGIIWTAQEKIKSLGEDQEEDELDEASTWTIPEVPDGVRSYLNANCDVIGRLYVTKADFKVPGKPGETVTKNQRRLWIGDNPRYDTGFRSEWDLPDMVKNPTVPELIRVILEGSKPKAKAKS